MNAPIRQNTMVRVRSMARTGQYTIAEIAFACGISHDAANRLAVGIEVKRKEPIKKYGLGGKKPQTVFEAIIATGHDDDFEACVIDCEPTSAPPGSYEKIAVLRKRAELGQPLWHRDDKTDYRGIGIGLAKNCDVSIFNNAGGPGIRVCPVPISGKGLEW